MSTQDWTRVRALFHRALECGPEARAALLHEIERDDEALAREVASLLAAHAAAEGDRAFLDVPRDDDAPSVAAAAGVVRLAIGDRLGPFEILALAGRGGMGDVYRARDTRLDRIVALKVVPEGYADDPHARARFAREARAISGLNHPHICTLYDVGSASPRPGAPDVPFLVMEFLEGRTLAQRLAAGPLDPADALRHARAIADALAAAHARGLVHRDLKPANIMLTASGPKLLDFGIARRRAGTSSSPASAPRVAADAGVDATAAAGTMRQSASAAGAAPTSSLFPRGFLPGTLRYMAPEQLRGEPADPRSDIFAFGIVLHEMLTGRPPFDAADDASVIAAVLTQPPAPLIVAAGSTGARARADDDDAASDGSAADDAALGGGDRLRMRDARAGTRTRVDDGAAVDDAAHGGDRARRPGARAAARARRADGARLIPQFSAIVARCLQKQPADRWASMEDVRAALAALDADVRHRHNVPYSVPHSARRAGARLSRLVAAVRPRRLSVRAIVSAAILAAIVVPALVLATMAGYHAAMAASPQPAARVAVIPPEGVRFEVLQISPDGQRIAFIGWTPEGSRIWMRALDSSSAQSVPGTDGVSGPLFWSPDSRYLAYVRQKTLLSLDTRTGATFRMADVDTPPLSGAWSTSGTVVIDAGKALHEGLFQVSARGGGVRKTVIRPDPTQADTAYLFPHFLPDGRRFLFSLHSTDPGRAGVYIATLDGRIRTRVLPHPTPAIYVQSGHLLFLRDSIVVAQRFNVDDESLIGNAMPIARTDGVSTISRRLCASLMGTTTLFSASQTGIVVHAANPAASSQFAWYDRTGRPEHAVASRGMHGGFALSRDGRRIAVSRADGDGGAWHIALIDLTRGVTSRLSLGEQDHFDPRWSPDGRLIATSLDTERQDASLKRVVTIAADGRETALLREPSRGVSIDDWSADGTLLYHVDRDGELLMTPVGEATQPVLVWRSPSGSAPDQARFSPDGRWIAYHALDSGRAEVYVTRVPRPGAGAAQPAERWQISSDGGVQPMWRGDGRELYYLGVDGKLFAVPIGIASAGRGQLAPLQPGAPRALFQTTIGPNPFIEQYAVNAAGSRFLLLEPDPRAPASVIDLVLNWPAFTRDDGPPWRGRGPFHLTPQ